MRSLRYMSIEDSRFKTGGITEYRDKLLGNYSEDAPSISMKLCSFDAFLHKTKESGRKNRALKLITHTFRFYNTLVASRSQV